MRCTQTLCTRKQRKETITAIVSDTNQMDYCADNELSIECFRDSPKMSRSGARSKKGEGVVLFLFAEGRVVWLCGRGREGFLLSSLKKYICVLFLNIFFSYADVIIKGSNCCVDIDGESYLYAFLLLFMYSSLVV